MKYNYEGINESQDIEFNEDINDERRILNYKKKDIEEYLLKVRELIDKGKYSIPLQSNRAENRKFIERYNLNSEKRKKILDSLTIYDFCYGTRNRNERYEHEILYVFF